MESRNSDDFRGTDRFDVRRRVGAGGMGAVYEAYDRDRDMRVAIKTILNVDASLIYRFKKEFRSLSDVSHPNLVKLYELILLENQSFYTMEFIEGVDFIRFVCPANALSPEDPLSDTAESYAILDSTHLTGEHGSAVITTDIDPSPSRKGSAGAVESTCEAVDSGSTALALDEGSSSGNDTATTQALALKADSSGDTADAAPDFQGSPVTEQPAFHGVRLRAALRQLTEALNVLHAMGKLHRDIKPSNVLVTRRGRVVLLDFGLSTEVEGREDHQSTTHGHIVGTAAYMAPEQAGGDTLSPASDWYSVGVMLYRALTGRLPFVGKSLDVMMKKQLFDPTEPRETNPSVPDDLNDLCVDLLQRIPKDRPTGEEILQRLGGPGGGLSPSAAAELEASGRTDAETLATHFDAAGQPRKAGLHYIKAAREASDALAFDRASTLFRRALELAAGTKQKHSLRRNLADALANAGRSHEAAQEYLRTCEDAGPAELQELRRALAFQLLMSGRIDEGLAVYREVLARFGLSMSATPRQAFYEMIVTRVILWFRGLGFRERPASEIPPSVLERVDTAHAVALGMTVVDWIRGSSFQSRSLLMALRAGEPLRIALSMAWEVVPSACGGKPAWRRTHRLIQKAGALSERLGDAHALGMAKLGRGAAEFLSSRFRAGVTISDEATAIIRERCPGAVWELDTSQIFAAWCLFYCGDINELRARCPRMAREARERGDSYLETTVNQFPRVVTLLADDDPDQGRHHSLESISKWSQQGFHVQHLTSFYGQMLTDLYKGDGRGAWRRFMSTLPDVESSLLLKIQHVYIDFLQYSGRVALAAGRLVQSSIEAEPLLVQARKAASKLDRQGLRWARAFAALVRGGIASTRGDESMAVARLREAIDGFDEVGLFLYATAARYKLGQLIGGDEGTALIARSNAWMAEQGIRAPEKMVRACVSGFPD